MHNLVNPGVLNIDQLREVCAQLGVHGRGVQCHYSHLPGAGKSFDIRLKAAREGLRYAHVPINNGFTSTGTLIDRIKENISVLETRAAQPGARNRGAFEGCLLHLDIASTVKDSLSRTLFGICVLGLVADNATATPRVFSFDPWSMTVSMELSPGLLDGAMKHCEIYPLIRNMAGPRTFEYNLRNLRDGMGSEFNAALNAGAMWEATVKRDSEAVELADEAEEDDDDGKKDKNNRQANAFKRLRYVCAALSVLERLNGSFPFRFGVKGATKLMNSPDYLFHRRIFPSGKGSAGDFIPLDGARCFRLLIEHSGLQKNPSLWCIWSFVNVLYWQLRDMHHPDSPINNVCMPDKKAVLVTNDKDAAEKGKVKGELLRFVIRTAREFATRQVSTVVTTTEDCVAVRLAGIADFLKLKPDELVKYGGHAELWPRQPFDNDGMPVFRLRHKFYLYFRSSIKRWVLDDSLNYSGSVVAESESADINSTYHLASGAPNMGGATHVSISMVETQDPFAFNGEAVEVKGCDLMPAGSSLGASENGLYLRQVPQEDINGKPLYKKPDSKDRNGNSVTPRYIFMCNTNLWACSTTCNETSGVCFWSNNSNPSVVTAMKTISFFPAQERLDMRVEKLTAAQYAAFLAGAQAPAALAAAAPARAAQAAARVAFGAPPTSSSSSSSEVIDLTDDDEKDTFEAMSLEAEANAMGIGAELARWKDSNHECVLFNNGDSYMVKFLSLDPEKLRESMNPILLRQLTTSHVVVGEDLQCGDGGELFWEILAGLTGIKRTREEAIALTGANFCLTGDCLLKILAIIYRTRCKIPVILLGECGCGKTMLLSFLCKWMGVKLLSLDVHGGTTEQDLIDVFKKAGEALKQPDVTSVYVFLDEVNTCVHMGLINEAICHRSLNGRRIDDGVQVLAALNPYRLRPDREEMGLSQNAPSAAAQSMGPGKFSQRLSAQKDENDLLNKLVYRVHPIPPTLRDFIFDFGSLEPATELLYIKVHFLKRLASTQKTWPQFTPLLVL